MFRRYVERRILTPGPTPLPQSVKAALVRESTNPDLDPKFFEEYKEVVSALKVLLGVYSGEVFVWAGEAMLGLEAAVANAVKPGTKVLVIDNGVYGAGFADLVEMYGGRALRLGLDWRRGIDPAAVDRALEREKDVEVVTLVHCDTPSTVYNNLKEVAKIVADHGAFLIVDAVSSAGADEIYFDQWKIGVLIAGSQKALNSPPGLTIMALSKSAFERAAEVKRGGFYINYFVWKEWLEKGGFPYTMPDVLIYALGESLRKILEEGLPSVYQRHRASRLAVRRALEAMGLEVYPASLDCTCPTATAFKPPIDPMRLRLHIWEKYGVMLGGSWGPLEKEVVRIGHMGMQASLDYVAAAITSLGLGLRDLGVDVDLGKALDAAADVFR
ncbi:MAG: alanine--glyoxylate aminotransferase family protein [Pyrobaculum sp.]